MSLQTEVRVGKRFEFGKNLLDFIGSLSSDRISESEKALCDFMRVRDLKGITFLDIGSGPGLSSPYLPGDSDWKIDEASILDRSHIEQLGSFDICNSWGVLHHTDSLW